MAATIAKARGMGEGKTAECSRLGHVAAEAEANTYRTFAWVRTNADGSVVVIIERDVEGRRELVVEVNVNGESAHPPAVTIERGTGVPAKLNGVVFR
jgi:Ribonuclease G/E